MRMSAHARQQSRRVHRPREARLLWVHPDNNQRSCHPPALLPLEQVQIRRQKVSVLLLKIHRLPQRVRLRQPLDRRRGLLLHQRRKRQRLRFPTHRLVRHQDLRRQMQPVEGRPPCRPGHRQLVNRQFIPSPGITSTFIRRAALTSIRTCRRIVFFIKRAKSVMRLRSMLYNLPAPTLRQRAGRSFPLLMRNVSSPI